MPNAHSKIQSAYLMRNKTKTTIFLKYSNLKPAICFPYRLFEILYIKFRINDYTTRLYRFKK